MSAIIILVAAVMDHNAYAQSGQSVFEITKISDLKNYSDTYLMGEAVKIPDEDAFRLEDSSGKIKVYTGWRNTNVVKMGEMLTVRGKLDPGIRKEFYATEIVRENGEVIKLISSE